MHDTLNANFKKERRKNAIDYLKCNKPPAFDFTLAYIFVCMLRKYVLWHSSNIKLYYWKTWFSWEMFSLYATIHKAGVKTSVHSQKGVAILPIMENSVFNGSISTPVICDRVAWRSWSLRWRHNERDGVSNHQNLDGLLNRFFRRRTWKHLDGQN